MIANYPLPDSGGHFKKDRFLVVRPTTTGLVGPLLRTLGNGNLRIVDMEVRQVKRSRALVQ